MAYKAQDIARYVINESIEKDYPVTNIKLQKLLYYIQAVFLIKYDRPCFDDTIVIWRHGPVILPVYNEYKKYIDEKIADRQTKYTELTIDIGFQFKYVTKEFNPEIIDKKDKRLINSIIYSYKDYDEWDMVEKIHKEDPFREISESVSNRAIKDCYSQQENLVYGQPREPKVN